MRAPGELSELGDAELAWAATIEATVVRALASDPTEHIALDVGVDARRREVEWPAVAQRPRRCLGRDRADRLADMRDTAGDLGRTEFQDEYAEWRMVRIDGRPVRFELTTELPDYWELLAARRPQRALAVLSAFAQRTVTARELFGVADPETLDSEQRAQCARDVLAPDNGTRPGDLNNGIDAITCLSHHTSTLDALVRLVVGSAAPMLTLDATSAAPRAATASEFIAGRSGAFAQDCRGSDPVVVERIVALACDGRRIGFDDPLGIYIVGVQTHELEAPSGDTAPASWIRLGRGRRRDGVSRFQRMTFSVPADQGFILADLRSRRTGETISTGAQIAELVQVGVGLKAGAPGVVAVTAAAERRDPAPRCGTPDECSELRRRADAMEQA